MPTYNSYRNPNSQPVDIRDTHFRPLRKYGIKEAHISRELRYNDHYYSSFSNINASISQDYYRPSECYVYEISLDQRGFDKMVSDLDRIDYEEWLRSQNPGLQAAWEHYQTVLGLVK